MRSGGVQQGDAGFRPAGFGECVPGAGPGRGGWILLCGLVLALFTGACAYSFTGSNLPGHIRTIAIPNLASETLEPGLDQETTAAILDRFIKDGRLKLAPESQADSRLIGTVAKYENRVYNYGPDESPRDYIVVVTLSIVLKDQVKNRELWKDEALTRTAVYVPGATTGLANEPDARADALRNLAAEIVTRTLEQW